MNGTEGTQIVILKERVSNKPPDPFAVSLSNHERPFDRLRVNGVFDTL